MGLFTFAPGCCVGRGAVIMFSVESDGRGGQARVREEEWDESHLLNYYNISVCLVYESNYA